MTPHTIPLGFELGYRWNADFQWDDLPFIIRNGDQRMVGMPYAYISDYHTYANSARTPRQMLDMLRDELRHLRREGRRGDAKMFGFALHPFLCRGLRVEVIHEFLSEAEELGDVWVTTRSEICDWVLDNPGEFESMNLEEVLAQFPTD